MSEIIPLPHNANRTFALPLLPYLSGWRGRLWGVALHAFSRFSAIQFELADEILSHFSLAVPVEDKRSLLPDAPLLGFTNPLHQLLLWLSNTEFHQSATEIAAKLHLADLRSELGHDVF